MKHGLAGYHKTVKTWQNHLTI